MKRLIVPLVLVVLLLTAGGIFWSRNSAAAQPYVPLGPGDTYLGLGDSLAAGWNAEVGRGFADLLLQRMQAKQPKLVLRNIAVPGETTGTFARRQLPAALRFIQEQQAAGKRVSPITISIGGNDVRNSERAPLEQRRATLANVKQNLAQQLDQLIAATKGPNGERMSDIVVMTYYNPWGGDPKNEQSAAYWQAALNKVIIEVASARNIPVADVATPFDDGKAYVWTYIATGDLHANNQGHQVIADQFWQALQY